MELSGVQSSLTSSSSYSSSSGGVTIEESSSSSSSSRSSSSSSSDTENKEIIKSTTHLTKEEKRRLEEIERRDREEAAAETGDSSLRHNKRVHSSTVTETSSQTQSSSSTGRGATVNRPQDYENSGYSDRGVRIESGSYGGRGSQGVLISERGNAEDKGGKGFDIYNRFDTDRNDYSSTRDASARVSSNNDGEENYQNRRRYGGTDQLIRQGPDGGHTYSESQVTNKNTGSNRQVTESEIMRRRNQMNNHGVDTSGSYGSRPSAQNPSRWGVNEDGTFREAGSSNTHLERGGNYLDGMRNHSYSKEETHSTDTKWDSESGVKPITHTSSSWRENEDGNVRSGSSANTYEELGVRHPINVDADRNHTITREEGHTLNTTWNSETGGRPITHVASSWKENENGKTRGGASSKTYEATNINIRDMMTNVNQHGSKTNTENSRGTLDSERSISRGLASENERRYGTTGSRVGDSQSSGSGSYSSGGESNNRRQNNHALTHNTNVGISRLDPKVTDPNGVLAPSSSYGQDPRRDFGVGSSGHSSQFDTLAGIAQGPRDGIARTYSFDILNQDNQKAGGGSLQHSSIAGIAAGTQEAGSRNTHIYDDSRYLGSDQGVYSGGAPTSGSQYSNTSSSLHRNGWSVNANGGKHYVSGAWNSEEGDVTDYSRPRGHDNTGYERSWRTSSTWETRNAGGSYEGNQDLSSRQARINPPQGENVENLIDEEPGVSFLI